IVIMLSKEFTILISIAFLIAAPIAWYFMHHWLQQYTYRIIMGAGFFIVTITCSLCIAWLTVGYTAIKAALANPVTSLSMRMKTAIEFCSKISRRRGEDSFIIFYAPRLNNKTSHDNFYKNKRASILVGLLWCVVLLSLVVISVLHT